MLEKLPWLGPIIVFGLVVFVHELGHFLAAKLMGVYAPRFSIGFGPALFKKRWGETEYVIAALPLGGYVRMASREDEATAFLEGGSEESPAAGKRRAVLDPEAMIPFGPKPVPEHRWFESKSLAARLFIMIAGVTMNVILALLVYIALTAGYGRQVVATRVVGGVQAPAWAPSLAGELQLGDTINVVNGRPIESWNAFQIAVLEAPDSVVTITTHRGDVRVSAGGPGGRRREELVLAVAPMVPPVIDRVVPDQPAAEAGLLAGDSIVAVGGTPVQSWSQLVERVSSSPERPLEFEIVRRGESRRITVEPALVRATNPVTGETEPRGQIGVAPRSIATHEPVGAGDAVRLGWQETWNNAGAIIGVVKGLLTGSISTSQLGGPIEITRASVAAARGGLEHLFRLLAFLSINVAVLNLLPIPILDGGQILLNVVEAAKGSAFSTRTREYIMRFGLLAIALLFALVMFNDLKRLWKLFT